MSDEHGMRAFEDRRWTSKVQQPAYRHHAALSLVRRSPILDVGAGDGLFLRMLSERGFADAKGLDLSPVAVERGRKDGLDVECVDITAPLPFADASFETVVALDVLEHVLEPANLLQEMGRVGREVVVTVPNFLHWRQRLQMLSGSVPFQARPARGHVHWFDEGILTRLAAEAGLGVDVVMRERGARLGRLGDRLAATRPSLFAVSIAARLSAAP
jgi:methionine biosynthesis protein MetW